MVRTVMTTILQLPSKYREISKLPSETQLGSGRTDTWFQSGPVPHAWTFVGTASSRCRMWQTAMTDVPSLSGTGEAPVRRTRGHIWIISFIYLLFQRNKLSDWVLDREDACFAGRISE